MGEPVRGSGVDGSFIIASGRRSQPDGLVGRATNGAFGFRINRSLAPAMAAGLRQGRHVADDGVGESPLDAENAALRARFLNHICKEIGGGRIGPTLRIYRNALINNYSNQLMYQLDPGIRFYIKGLLWRF
ncbi:hypothetical protein [Rhizobium aouanii]|uniref:Uncharacterized protein n=1 Tax=Rhizobium aouanii TaxID=3118145 RepID=A0ABU8CKN8_9HYPH